MQKAYKGTRLGRRVFPHILVIFSLICLGGSAGAGGPPAGLKPAKPVRCTGVGNITISKKLIKTSGVGVELIGTCSITIVDSRIEAGAQALKTSGTGDIIVRNSTIQGKNGAVSIVGTGNVRAKGSTLVGEIQQSGTGRFIDEGGNTLSSKGGAVEGDRSERKPGRATPIEDGPTEAGGIVCKGDEEITLTGRTIKTAGIGVTVQDNCRAKLIGCQIQAGAYGVLVSDNGELIIQGSTIRGGKAAVRIQENGTIKAKGSTFQGGVKKEDNGEFVNQGGNTIK
jgi:hypothetical protein